MSLFERVNTNHVRVFFITVLVIVSTILAAGWIEHQQVSRGEKTSVIGTGKVAPQADNVTVITTSSPNADNALVAIGESGRVLFKHTQYDTYYDVDPSPEGSHTVLVNAAIRLDASECPAETAGWTSVKPGCTVNIIERINISTGETERVFSRTLDWREYHDADRIGENRIAVADIENNRVFIANTSTNQLEYVWDAQNDINITTGGPFPQDWTHLNDVEYLHDGRLMVDLRNQDRVVFVDPKTGVDENWTLGEEDNYSILSEQHNPDYIPISRGGPAVIVADSQNNRAVEFQRRNGSWVETWVWTAPGHQWTRDADRLPNGNTLITGSGNDRVVEVDRSGEIVWSVRIDTPYEAERLGTGDESAGGQSAFSLGLDGRETDVGSRESDSGDAETAPPIDDRIATLIRSTVPPRLLNGFLFMLPGWMNDFKYIVLLFVGFGALVAWAGYEFRISNYRLLVRRSDSEK